MPDTREIRRYRRLQGWDYRRGAVLFVTIVTEPRRALFGKIERGEMRLSPLGEIVQKALADMTSLNPGLAVKKSTVMPDHVHFNVYIKAGLDQPLKVFGKAITRFKNYTTKQAKVMGLVGHSRLVGHSPTISTARGLPISTSGGLPISTAGGLPISTAGGLPSPAISTASPITATAGGLPSPVISTASPIIATAGGLAISTTAGKLEEDRAGMLEGCARMLDDCAGKLEGCAQASGDGRAVPGHLWQQGCHDRLCLRRAFIDATERYIAYNAQKWELMYGAGSALRIHEPLDSPCLDPGDYWKGVGNVALLDGAIISLRVSRQVRTPAQITAVVARMKRAVERGYVILSGFISPGEKAVCDMLCATPAARFIRILPTCIPNARFRPESRYVPAFSEGRYLEIAQGNDEVAFGRAACLDYNAEIVAIAQASTGGMALYWKGGGVHRLGAAQPSPLRVGREEGAAQPSPLRVGREEGAAQPSPLRVSGEEGGA